MDRPALEKGKATICIVNYKTPEFIRLCLRSIRKFTKYPYEVIVVDNDSGDESVAYLRGLKWIRLLERKTGLDEEAGGFAHAAGLDLGLENCGTEFFVAMHSDTFVQRAGWLGELIGYFGGDERTACVGSGKLELQPRWRFFLKQVTDLRTFNRKLLNGPDPQGRGRYYNRTICCLYRTDILRREHLSFIMERRQGLTAGKKLYFELVDRGYGAIELPAAVMGRYVVHLAHATQAVNPQEFALRKRTMRKYSRTANKIMAWPLVQDILSDNSLDE